MNDTTDSKPIPYYFISYSRQEVTFVDSFSRELEKRGIRNWVDFRNLVPGHPWQPQLDEAVQNADAILLVVSKASMSSGPVKDEWTKSLAAGRRIILILFEPCKLDPGLAGLEWVDFTKRFDRAIDRIITLLESPLQTVIAAVPEKKIHLPRAAVAPMGLSLLLAILLILQVLISSLFFVILVIGSNARYRTVGWPDPTPFDSFLLSVMLAAEFSLWLPSFANFLWLPVQIARRRHNAQTTGYVLYALLAVSLFLLIVPFVSSLAGDSLKREYPSTSFLLSDGYFWLTAITVIAVVLMIRLLRSEGMYRWSGPRGAVILSGPPDLMGHTDNGVPMRILVESAPQDQLYARELKDSITRAGHICTDDIQSTDIVLPLLSKYKTNSSYDPETIPLIPTLLQSCDVDKHLSRLQWADLRYGKVSMDALANLLDEPTELLRLIGVLPVRTLILPGTINLLSNLMSILLFFLFFQVILSIPASLDDLPGFLLWLILLAVYYFFRKYLTDRKLKYRPILSYWWAVALTALSALAGSLALQSIQPTSLLLWLIPLLMLRKDVRMWLPARTKGQLFDRQPALEQPAAPP